jgi:hypothetical protein
MGSSETPLVGELKRFQRVKRWSNVEFAAQLEMHPNGLSKIVNRGSIPNGETIGRMARLGIRFTKSILLSLGLPAAPSKARRATTRAH